RFLKEDDVIVLGNSTIAAHVLQLGIEKKGQRIINNMNLGSMGYDVPAAIGAAVAKRGAVTLITGDGSFMLNLQELQTIRHYDVPVKILLACNGGYRGIVRSQSNMFGHYVGCTKDTGVEMPDFEKVANAFGIKYLKIREQSEVHNVLRQVYEFEGPVICEWPQDPNQVIEPRVMNRKSEDGCIISTQIDDLSPFLSKEEYEGLKFDNWLKKREA
ncbi:MAG: thiamine pyrophosphate-binding protein, partial [Bacilli bacterium]|nr:thiamine pyrophosphate-binding protein [Bacilli bacterium]